MFSYLLSYHYYRDTDLDHLAEAAGAPDLTFLADSGAFSAEHAAGASVVLDEYVAWLRRWEHRIHAYAALDVLGDVDASVRNVQTMQAMGLTPLPVFHLGEPLSVLDDYCATADYVAIGGMVKASLTMRDPKLWAYLAGVHKRAGATRLHGFGLSSWPVIKRFPWYSVDSSAAGSGYRYGRVMAYDPYADTFRMWALRDRQAWHRNGWLVREYGMSPEDFKGENTAIRGALIAIAARSWSRAAASLGDEATKVYVTDTAASKEKGGPKHGDVLRQWQDGNTHEATRVYVSDPHPSVENNYARIKAWYDGNQGARVYVTDGALGSSEPTYGGTRLGAYQDGNVWTGAG